MGDPAVFASAVQSNGGIVRVITESKWQDVRRCLKPEPEQQSSTGNCLLNAWAAYFPNHLLSQPRGAENFSSYYKKGKKRPEPKKTNTGKKGKSPKKAWTAYMYFNQATRPRIIKENPDASSGELAKIISFLQH